MTAVVFIAPAAVFFLTFHLVPIASTIWLSLTDWDPLAGGHYIGLANYTDLIHDRVFRAALSNTAIFTGVTVLGSVGLGLVCALLVNSAWRGGRFFRVILLMPFVMMSVASALGWRWMFLPEQGLINSALKLVGINGPNWLVSGWAMPALIMVSIWKGFGYNMILFLAGLTTIPRQMYEAAEIDGAGPWRKLTSITLPLLSPTTFLVVVVAVINTFQVFDQAYALTSGGPGTRTTTIVLYIYELGFEQFSQGYASAVATVLFAILVVLTAIQFRIQRRWVHHS